MGQKLPPHQLRLYKRIDEILFYKWDPIGVSDSVEARDEYQSYLPTVFRLVMENDTPEAVANYLHELAWKGIGLIPSRTHSRAIASMLLQAKNSLLTQSSE
jgi:hypothetical protein